MKIAILSDVHDHRDNLHKCLNNIKEIGVDHILHLGDYGAPGLSVKPLVTCGIPVTGIRGNNDGDKRAVTKFFENAENCEILGTVYGSIELGGKRIFMVHYHDLYETIAKSGDYDLVVYGHNHLRDCHAVGDTIVCNPGAICGNKESASYAVYDTEIHDITHIEL